LLSPELNAYYVPAYPNSVSLFPILLKLNIIFPWRGGNRRRKQDDNKLHAAYVKNPDTASPEFVSMQAPPRDFLRIQQTGALAPVYPTLLNI
jgi:hypothetical protein